MKVQSSNSSSLLARFNSSIAHILLQNDQNEVLFVALYLENLNYIKMVALMRCKASANR